MPIPAHILSRFSQLRIERPNGSDTATPLEPGSGIHGEWGFAPGILEGVTEKSVLDDLDKRCKQAQIATQAAWFHTDKNAVEGRVLLGITRERAMKLGYKLRLWAIFQISDAAIRIVYTGHNSRER